MIEVKDRPRARPENMAFPIRRIGVIGAGQMGSGIAHVSALAGFEIKLNDLSADRIKAGIATINGNMARQVSRKRITEEERQAALKRITPAEKYDAFEDCDLIIEAATEKEEVKRSILPACARCSGRRPSSAATLPRSRSRGSLRRPTGRSGSSAFIS